MIPNTKENQTILLNLSKSAIHADDTNLAKASTSGACNLIFPFKKNKLGAYWRLVTQVYPIFPLKKNKLGAYWWLVTQIYPIFPLKIARRTVGVKSYYLLASGYYNIMT